MDTSQVKKRIMMGIRTVCRTLAMLPHCLFHLQLNGLLLTSQLVCCQLTALTKKDLLNTDSFHRH